MTATSDETDCDRAAFDADVTIPDDTTLDPSTDFTKTWRLNNVGTCTWTTEYALVFVDGEQMGGAEAVPFPASVAPDTSVELSVDLTSPASPGTYRGNWQLRNAEGRLFGIGDDADKPFWVQIVVGEVDDELGLGTPDWRDPMNSSANWFMVDTDDTRFEVKDGNLVMESINSGTIDEWGLSIRPNAKDFYLEITATTGDTCSGLDRYGVVIRAQDPDELYVYGFSCNGRYRMYKWDGEYTEIKSWTSSSQILAGPDQTNQLGIWAEGDTFKFYANRKLLAEVTDSTYSEGRFGLFVGSSETDGFQVFVDEVAFWVVGD
jgi:hypothetical protein